MYFSCTHIATLVFSEVYIRTKSIHDVVQAREIYTLARTFYTPLSGFCCMPSTKHIKDQGRIKESQILKLKWWISRRLNSYTTSITIHSLLDNSHRSRCDIKLLLRRNKLVVDRLVRASEVVSSSASPFISHMFTFSWEQQEGTKKTYVFNGS